MKTIGVFAFIFMILCRTITGSPGTVTLKTGDLNECIEITAFLANTKGEIFLFSTKMSKIFKFKENGDFEKSFCSYGIGPGEVKRVVYMFHNPANDFLYLPEISSGVPRVTVFDSDGKFKNYLDIEVTATQKDDIHRLVFLDDGSFYAYLVENAGWEPAGKVYVIKNKYSVLYFDKYGKFKSKIYETHQIQEMSSGPGWGGPRILFFPQILIRKTPEGNICIGKTDENVLHIYSKTGAKLGTATLEMERLPLSDSEFEKAKAELVELHKKDPRMQWLAKRMIKLENKPIYQNYFVIPDYYVIVNVKKESEFGYTKETSLTFFDKKGKRKSIKSVKGYVMNISTNRLYIKEYDDEENERFRIEEFN